nr:hypothetical protein [Fredinandcohnia onubensis]
MPVTVANLINIPVSNAAIRWAAYTSLKKFPHTSQGIRPRPPLVILDNLFQGDLAKSALIEYFLVNSVAITQEFDRVRTDNFVNYNTQGFHFIANNSRIEVNSSNIPSGDTVSSAIQRDIKVTASNGGPITYPLALPFDITVQLYFDTQPNRITNQYNYQQLVALANEVQSPEDEALDAVVNALNANVRYSHNLIGYGWATTTDIDQIRLNNVRNGRPTTWSYPNNSRTYWRCKIQDTNPFVTLPTSV